MKSKLILIFLVIFNCFFSQSNFNSDVGLKGLKKQEWFKIDKVLSSKNKDDINTISPVDLLRYLITKNHDIYSQIILNFYHTIFQNLGLIKIK